MARGELSGKTAIVSGAGRGMGRAMALGLARAGANVVITAARTGHEIEMVADEVVKIREAGTIRPVWRMIIDTNVVGLPELRGGIEEFLADEMHPQSGVVYEDVNRSWGRTSSGWFWSLPTE